MEDSLRDGNRVVTMEEFRDRPVDSVLDGIPRGGALLRQPRHRRAGPAARARLRLGRAQRHAATPSCANPRSPWPSTPRSSASTWSRSTRMLDVGTGITSYLAAHTIVEFLGRICDQPRWTAGRDARAARREAASRDRRMRGPRAPGPDGSGGATDGQPDRRGRAHARLRDQGRRGATEGRLRDLGVRRQAGGAVQPVRRRCRRRDGRHAAGRLQRTPSRSTCSRPTWRARRRWRRCHPAPTGRRALAEIDDTMGDRLRAFNRWACAVAAAHPEITPFVAVDPGALSAEANVAHLRELAALGARGVKLHPVVQRFSPDDPRMLPVYRACVELGLTVLSHSGTSGGRPSTPSPGRSPRSCGGFPTSRSSWPISEAGRGDRPRSWRRPSRTSPSIAARSSSGRVPRTPPATRRWPG